MDVLVAGGTRALKGLLYVVYNPCMPDRTGFVDILVIVCLIENVRTMSA